MSEESDRLADNELFGIIYTVTDKPDWAVSEVHDAILAAGYQRPKKVKGNTPLGKIRELFKHLDSWESQEHTTVGIDYLRRHFKDAA